IQNEDHLLKNCPREFYAIFDHIRYLNYSDRPDYALIMRKLREICKRKHYLPDDPYDWEKGGRFYEEQLRALQKGKETRKQEKTECISEERNDKSEVLKVEKSERDTKQQTDEMKLNNLILTVPMNESLIGTNSDEPEQFNNILQHFPTENEKWTRNKDGRNMENVNKTGIISHVHPEHLQCPSTAE
ncbi:unnamed protein product, partial [Acanthocheilonema viteae]